VTDRYARAIEQLGSDKLDVRIGGIHALERIARDSPRDHPTIMAVLAAFILEHSRDQWPPAEPGAEPPERTTRPDVQAAATVIGRRNSGHSSEQINLNAAVLTRADLTGADLTGANLAFADLTGADLTGANLIFANFAFADLTGADLTGANLTFANLIFADLTRADLTFAVLTRADLTGANLARDDLTGGLGSADLTGADLSSSLWPSDAAVPEGWRRDTDSGRLKRTDRGPEEAGD
jgi:hypothetical protein